MKRTIPFILMLIGLTWCTGGVASEATRPIDLAQARQYFAELKAISDADGGRLWGVRLYGATMFVDPNTSFVVANQPDEGGQLTADDGVYTGNLGSVVNTANTATQWSGTYWTMVRWNALSGNDSYDRARLLAHESWHRIQGEIGIPSAVTSNVHLDNSEGRLALLLEFRALSEALTANVNSSDRSQSVAAALILRRARQAQFPDNNENAFERHEGMAEYTGLKLCGLPDSLLRRVVAKKLQIAEQSEGLANSFAYLTGPAYGLLLDEYYNDWRSQVRAGAELPTLLANAIELSGPANAEELETAATEAGRRYDADKLRAAQQAVAAEQDKVVETFRNRIKAHGQLIILNDNLQFNFNPMEKLVTFDSTGVIYHTMRLSGDFGVLEVADGILRTNDWQFFVVAGPDKVDGDPIVGEGYELQLHPDWRLAARSDKEFVIEKK